MKIQVELSLNHEEFNALRKLLGNTDRAMAEKLGLSGEEDRRLTELYKKMTKGLRQLELSVEE